MAPLDRGLLRLLKSAPVTVTTVAVLAASPVIAIQPVIGRDFPDPSVIAVGSTYYAYSTASGYPGGVRHVPVESSRSLLSGWAEQGDAMPDLPPWVAKDSSGSVWAPEVAARSDGSYLLYFTARAAAPFNVQCIGAALSRSPKGPFRSAGDKPLVCHPEEMDSIDPKGFTDSDGSQYLVYTSGRGAATIWIQPVTRDGVSAVGERRQLIRADRPEEANIVEAPTLFKHSGEYVLFYSANAYNSGRYFVNYATSKSIDGPFVKAAGALLNRDVLGGSYSNPGGQDVIPGRKEDYLVFHAYTAPNQRSMFVAGLGWENGKPTIRMDVQARRDNRAAAQTFAGAGIQDGQGLPPARRGVRSASGG